MSKMPPSLQRSREVSRVIDDIARGTKHLAGLLGCWVLEMPERINAVLSYPTIAIRVVVECGAAKAEVDFYDRSRPHPSSRPTDFVIPLDTAHGRDVTPGDVLSFLSSKTWLDAARNRLLLKAMISAARAEVLA